MQIIVTAKEMKSIDTYSIKEIGIPSLVLMERAALAVTERILSYRSSILSDPAQQDFCVWIAAGTGNNGADGLAIARMLSEFGIRSKVIFVGNEEKATAEWKHQANILKKLDIPIYSYENLPKEETAFSPNVVVDAVFGIGITREVEGMHGEFLEKINESGAYTISVDIPSGISADTGAVLKHAVRADETVTFGYQKRGLLLNPGKVYAGKVSVAKIGFPAKSLEQSKAKAFSFDLGDVILKDRDPMGNKGTFGKILIFAGNERMAGAACFAAKAAIKTGAGLVRILTRQENRVILQTLVPEAVISCWNENTDAKFFQEAASWADVIAAGPGIGTDADAAAALENILKASQVPVVLDADGLNLLALHSEWKKYLHGKTILTPHPGEMARLMRNTVEDNKKDPVQSALQAAEKFGCVVVAKDAASVIASPEEELCINTTGNDGMAVGGSGDVLTGLIAGMLAAGLPLFLAAAYGTHLHGAAGDLARDKYGTRAMGPMDMIEEIGFVLKGF